MKIALIKERKIPIDKRVVFAPRELISLKKLYPEIDIKIESSDIRVFSDKEYIEAGFEVSNDISDCDVLLGVKEVPVEALIPNKKYFFFSHTIKKQPLNKKLLKACLEKNITLYDHETVVDNQNKRLIGFGTYAGNVGCYNALRAFGLKYELFNLVKVASLKDKTALLERLKRIVLPNIKIVLTGQGKVSHGVQEILDAIKIKKISPEDYLKKKYDNPVYTVLNVEDYYKRMDGKNFEKEDFFKNADGYVSNFERFTKVSDIFITGHFYATGSPAILTQEMLKASDFNIKVIADISCDVNESIYSTLRVSTIEDPFYGYLPGLNKEIDYHHPAAVVIMAVDNLPCELPLDASLGFGEMFSKYVIPAFFNNDKDGILDRSKITENGSLTKRFSYLQDFVNS
jgi:alanine dehydrogenase